MTAVTADLIYDVLKALRSEVGEVKGDVRELRAGRQAMRGHLLAMSQDTSNLYQIANRRDWGVQRIETRLGLVDPAH